MIQVNEKKLKRQLLGVEKWRKNSGRGILNYATGVGKTYSALIIINKLFSHNPSTYITIVVPSEELQKQWKNEIKANISGQYNDNIKVHTVHYIIENNLIIHTDLLIVDELHEFYTEDRVKIVLGITIQYKWILCLTATVEDINNRHLSILEHISIVDIIGEEEALKEGYISKFIEYNLACYLTEEEKKEYKYYTDIISKNITKFGNNSIAAAQYCLQGGRNPKDGKDYTGIAYCYMYSYKMGWKANMDLSDDNNRKLDDLWNPSKVMGYAKGLLNAIRERKNILYNAKEKIRLAVELTKKFDKLKTICFSQSTIFADKLANAINGTFLLKGGDKVCVVYHSKLNTIERINDKGKTIRVGKKRLRDEAIEAIRSGKARVISTASSLDKGFDVKDIRLGITTSGTQNPTQYKQRGGRVKRIESYTEDIIVLIINIYLDGTKDEDWLRTRQSKSNNVIYWVDSIDKINYTPRENKVFSEEEL